MFQVLAEEMTGEGIVVEDVEEMITDPDALLHLVDSEAATEAGTDTIDTGAGRGLHTAGMEADTETRMTTCHCHAGLQATFQMFR